RNLLHIASATTSPVLDVNKYAVFRFIFVSRSSLNKHLNNRLLLCFREFIAAALNRRKLFNARAPNATGVDATSVVVFQNEGWCPICEARVTFSARNSWFRDHYLCDRCGSIPRERALMHVIQTRYPNWR